MQARYLRFGLADYTGAWFGDGADFAGSVLPATADIPLPLTPVSPPPAPQRPASNLPRPIITEPETVRPAERETPRPPRRLGLWLAAGAAVLGAAAMVLLKVL